MDYSFMTGFRHITSRRLWIVALIAGAAAIFWVCTFKIMDRDFWWHIKAGEILLKNGSMITTDPFAYTRAGLPYLATHEWLAQIVLFLIYHTGGSTAIILFRGVVACACVGMLLQLTYARRFIYIALGVWSIVMTKGSFLERPQLFTFLFFCTFIVLAFRFLDASSKRTRMKLCASFILMELIWVNMHGGAALLGCAVVTFLLIQSGTNALLRYDRQDNLQSMWLLAGTLILMAITFVLPPNGLSNLNYVANLLNDKTIGFIAEWQPRTCGLYLRELLPFFVLSCAALIAGRKHMIFNLLLLLATAYLSRQAFRHEILFVFASVATCFYQWDRSAWMLRAEQITQSRSKLFATLFICLLLLLARTAYNRSFLFERQDNLFGFGQFDLARGAMDFVERENITGNMFNTYGIGGYLIYRGYPDRKVFIDGRNVDYGFEFMARAHAAAINPDSWAALEHAHSITYAIIDYDAIREGTQLPYNDLLAEDPDWALIYADDWVAVYLRRVAQNQPWIDRLAFTSATVRTLQFQEELSTATDTELAALTEDLHRMQSDNPDGVKAALALASIALKQGNAEEAERLALQARSIRRASPEPVALLAAIEVQRQQWEKAAAYYATLLRLAGDQYPDINYAYIADVYRKAGKNWWTWLLPNYEEKEAAQETASGSALTVNPATDAIIFHDEGIALTEAGSFAEAEQAFLTTLKINPGFAEAWNNLCALQLDRKRPSEAVDTCTRAIGIHPDYGDAHYNLALAHFYLQQWESAAGEAIIAHNLGLQEQAAMLLTLIEQRR